MEEKFNFRTMEFTVPSGFQYVIREQNGEDEDILTNPVDAKNLMNITKFICSIVVKTNYTPSGVITIQDSLNMPILDRYTILLNSRIFSLGNILEFDFLWPTNNINKKDKVSYEQDLEDFLFDYGTVPTEEELNAKPDAIPFYPDFSNCREFMISTGKKFRWDHFNGNGESFLMSLPDEQRTRNSAILARNIRIINENGEEEKITNFKNFTSREMHEIHKYLNTYDPSFEGTTEIVNPKTGETARFPIMSAPTFFFLTEM